MSTKIAVAGKGGSGKTSVASGLIAEFIAREETPVLAVDADPNWTLCFALACEPADTVAEIREERQPPAGMSRPEYLELRMQEALVEHEGFDLLVMGRPEGAGCYCAVNNLLRKELGRLGRGYRAVVMDNEAGLEHLSRRTTEDVDVLLVVAQPNRVGLASARRVVETSAAQELAIGRTILVLNGVRGDPSEAILHEVEEIPHDSLCLVPWSEELWQAAEAGDPVSRIPRGAAWWRAISQVADAVLEPEPARV
ncbi:MAG: carbon monoxide dehydrogenase [Armatimonadia bacterium]|nr:carbon monoxide dehydrogenase [Armatimonadia bacterium]